MGSALDGLILVASEVERFLVEMALGVSVLLALKAAADFGVDLRNHDRERTWRKGYAHN